MDRIEEMAVMIDLLSYVGKFGNNNPNKGIYSKQEIECIVDDITKNAIDWDYDLDKDSERALDLMLEADVDLENLKQELSTRIYDGLNDKYNPYPDMPEKVRKGLDLKDDDDIIELLMDIENEYVDFIVEESGTFDEERGDDEGYVGWCVKDVITIIFNKTIEAFYVKSESNVHILEM